MKQKFSLKLSPKSVIKVKKQFKNQIPNRWRNSYTTFKFRTSFKTKQILSSFYAPLPFATGVNKSTVLETRADIILFRAHWAKSIAQARHFLKYYLPSAPKYLKPGDVISINPSILPSIFNNKLLHLKYGNPIPNYIITNTFSITLLKNPTINEISFPPLPDQWSIGNYL